MSGKLRAMRLGEEKGVENGWSIMGRSHRVVSPSRFSVNVRQVSPTIRKVDSGGRDAAENAKKLLTGIPRARAPVDGCSLGKQ